MGIGMALGLARAGANVVVAGRDTAKTDQAVEQIQALGVDALGITVDVSQEAEVGRMVGHTVETLGSVDILVNNAGISVRAQPQDLSA